MLLRVRYSECDAQNVVFNARYGDYVDIAVTEYYRVAFGGYQKLLEQGLDSQVVSMKTDWTSSAKFDDVIAITVTPLRFGNTSYSLGLQFSDHASGRAIAYCEITYVMVTTDTYSKTAIPEDFRQSMSAPLPRIVDFSGPA